MGNCVRCNEPFWLCNDIYSKSPNFSKIVIASITKKKIFCKMQEMARKDIERVFGVLQYMQHITSISALFQFVETMKNIMKCVIIVHDIVIEARMFQMPGEEEQFTKDAVVRSGCGSMWKGMIPTLRKTNVGDTVGTLAGKCALEVFKDRVDEHYQRNDYLQSM